MCVSQAVKSVAWQISMSNEVTTLLCNGTKDFVPPLSSQNVVGCKWVFRIKRNPEVIISRYKAHLATKGFHQWLGVDFHDTFSPIFKPATVRIVLTLALSHGWPLRQLDVNNAFLHDTLSKDVFMQQTPTFVDLC